LKNLNAITLAIITTTNVTGNISITSLGMVKLKRRRRARKKLTAQKKISNPKIKNLVAYAGLEYLLKRRCPIFFQIRKK